MTGFMLRLIGKDRSSARAWHGRVGHLATIGVVRWLLVAAVCALPAVVYMTDASDDLEDLLGWSVAIAVGGFVVGVAASWILRPWLAPRGHLTPIVDALARHRHLLIVLYLCVLAGWMYVVATVSGTAMEAFPLLAGHKPSESPSDDTALNVTFACLFVGLHALFLAGGGRVRLGEAKPGLSRLALSIAVFAVLMSLVTIGALLTLVQLTARFGPDFRPSEQELAVGTPLLAFALTGWALWLPIGWAVVREETHPGALTRLTGILLAGSWLEFFTALPVELAIRPRTESCPCDSGSWFGLIIAGPILLWTFGPAVVLLYVRERRLNASGRRHTRRVVAAKTSRRRVEGV